jgi:hypothetical protein
MARKIPPPPTTNHSVDSWEYRNWFNLLWRRVKNLEGGGGATEKGDEDAIHVNWANEITGITQKSSLVDADEFVIEDSADSYNKKAVTFSNLQIATSIGNVTSKTANYTVTGNDKYVLCDTSGGAFTITLPASPETGRSYTIVLETAGNTLTIAGNGNNIMGASSATTAVAGTAMDLMYDGTQWNMV